MLDELAIDYSEYLKVDNENEVTSLKLKYLIGSTLRYIYLYYDVIPLLINTSTMLCPK